jgi:hypothetical protein
MSAHKPAAKRKPKYVPPVDLDGNYTVDAAFAELFPEHAPKEPQTRGAAYRSPAEPPPEETWPARRRSPLADERPRWTGKPKPGRSRETPS